MILGALCPIGYGAEASVAAKNPTTQPAEPTVSRAEALSEYIKIIKTDDDPSVVLRAYTKACSINRLDPQLNSVYMRRMLLMGRPRAAYMPARILSAQDADAGLAWAVIGYMLGRSNKYLDSMTATARALEFNSDDRSILNNVGQLAAWFDNAPAPPRLGDREKRIMDKLKDKFAKSKAYTDAYDRVNGMYVESKKARAAVEARLAAAEAEYNRLRTEELTLTAEIKRINAQIIQQNEALDQLEKDLRRNRNKLNVRDEHGRYIYNQRFVLAENTRIELAIRDAAAKKDALRKEGTPIMPRIKIASSRGAKLRKDISADRRSLKGTRPAILKQLRWDPPSVDGVFTPESNRVTPKVKPKPTTQESTKVTGSAAEEAAAKKLKMAKLYVNNNRQEKAREIILEILEKYPKTRTAAKASALLKTILPK